MNAPMDRSIDRFADVPLPPGLPCPFCGSAELTFVHNDDLTDCCVTCDGCLCEGPVATIGCWDEDEDGPCDLEMLAVEAWNKQRLMAIVIAFIKDRGEQYRAGTGVHAAFEELLEDLRRNDHVAAYMHGELDDLLPEDG